MPAHPLAGRTALITGANHGIGAATTVALARLGADVAISYLRLDVADDDPGRPPDYAQTAAARTPTQWSRRCESAGARCVAVEADLADPATPGRLFDEVEAALGPVSILVNNASGWRRDTFAPETGDPFGRPAELVGTAAFDAQFLVDARGSALLIAELADAASPPRRRAGAASSASPRAGRTASRAKPRTAQPRPRSRTTP